LAKIAENCDHNIYLDFERKDFRTNFILEIGAEINREIKAAKYPAIVGKNIFVVKTKKAGS
jgi:hypothetical protein